MKLVHHCLTEIGLDPDTGKFDIDRISSGVTSSERGNIVLIKEMISELETMIELFICWLRYRWLVV